MAETTGIAWTDSTFNPWVGCTKVGPGCDHCYAEALDKRHRWKGVTHWGSGVERMRTAPSNWAKPLAWNKKAAVSGKPWRVFCASLADVFDNEVPKEWRVDLFDLIHATPALTWLLLTKRIGNVAKCGAYTYKGSFPPNVWLGASVVNQEEADRDIPKLLDTPAALRFVSYEPALGPVVWRGEWLAPRFMDATGPKRRIDWIIVGGESSQGSAKGRPFALAWARSTIEQCLVAGVPVFVKQIGSRPVAPYPESRDYGMMLRDRAGAEPAEWPADLRVQEFPLP